MTSLLTTIRTSIINGNTGSTLAIGNNLTTDAIQIGTSTNNTITIGGANTTTTINGTLRTSTIGAIGSTTTINGTLRTSTINGNVGSTLNIGNNLTTDEIKIGTSTNKVTIGIPLDSSTIINGTLQTYKIDGLPGSSLSIGTNLTTDTIDIGSSLSTTVVNIRATAVCAPIFTPEINASTNMFKIGNSTTTPIYIGHSNGAGSTIINGDLSVTRSLTTNGFTINGSNNISLGDGTSAPFNNQLGYIISTTAENPPGTTPLQSRVRFNGAFNVFSDNDSQGIFLFPGTWLMNYAFYIGAANSVAANWVYNVTACIVTNAGANAYGTIVGGQFVMNFKQLANYGLELNPGLNIGGSTIVQITANAYYNVRLAVLTVGTPSGTINLDPKLTAVRIA